jgi:hypothetical protein
MISNNFGKQNIKFDEQMGSLGGYDVIFAFESDTQSQFKKNRLTHLFNKYVDRSDLFLEKATKRLYTIYTKDEKLKSTIQRATLCYLLQYQHYNADFTEDENDRLGYPQPLYCIQAEPVYMRSEENPILELSKDNPILKWSEKNIIPFLKKLGKNYEKQQTQQFISVSSTSALEVLKIFKFNEKEIIGFSELKNKIKDNKFVISINITFKELKEEKPLEFLNNKLKEKDKTLTLELLIEKHQKLEFLFVFQEEGIDCVLLWGALLNKENKKITLVWRKITSLFTKNVLGNLSQAGAVPDRQALHELITSKFDSHRPFNDQLKDFGIIFSKNFENNYLDSSEAASVWTEQIKIIGQYTFDYDPGSELYRDAICQWDKFFFNKYKMTELASLLLCSRVLPWISNNDITKWAKGYQNLCEIVMFCIQSNPDLFSELDFGKVLIKKIDPDKELSSVDRFAGLFPYGMSSIFFIFQHILKTAKNLSVACISQNYFETLTLIEKMGKTGSIRLIKNDLGQFPEKLKDIEKIPDILIADIHPNNAAKEELYQNNIGDWVENILNDDSSKSMTLILDITLNCLTDDVVGKILKKFKPFIKNGQLEFFGIISLAKLMQLGADNFSGGGCIYLGSDTSLKFPKQSPEKSAFFSLLSQNFQEIMKRYVDEIRENTQWMYNELNICFSEIKNSTWIDKKNIENKMQSNSVVKTISIDTNYTNIIKSEKSKEEFCAMETGLNTDEGAVYVAINFKPLFDVFDEENDENKKNVVTILRDLLLKMAGVLDLPLTGRQSFGFSLSNMSCVVQTIRFSIGVENQALCKKYIELISCFSRLLSSYVVAKVENAKLNKINKFIEGFKNSVDSAINILLGKEKFDENNLSSYYLLSDSNLKEKSDLSFHNGQLSINITIEEKQLTFKHNQIGISRDRQDDFTNQTFSKLNLIELFFTSQCLNRKPEVLIIDDGKRLLNYESKVLFLDNKVINYFSRTHVISHRTHVISHKCDDGKQIECAIGGIFNYEKFSHDKKVEIEDEVSGIKIKFKVDVIKKLDYFNVTLKNGNRFHADRIFIEYNENEIPINIKKLSTKKIIEDVFSKCAGYSLGYLLSEKNRKITIQFIKEKSRKDYQENICKSNPMDAVNFLNSLDLDHLPLDKNHSWQNLEHPNDSLHNALIKLAEGMAIGLRLSSSKSELIESLNITDTNGDILQVIEAFSNIKSTHKKYKEIIMTRLKKLQHKWIFNPGFHHKDTDFQKKIKTFFDEIGCKSILLYALERVKYGSWDQTHILEAGFRWAIMTQDSDLFSKLMEIYQDYSLPQYKIDVLSKYKTYLKSSVRIQNNL